MTRHHRVPGAALLRLYPRTWRRVHEDEMVEVLALRRLRPFDRFDLVRGAVDAHLHPQRRSIVPAATALAGGGAWTAAALVTAAQPAPPDWPGYLADVLPLTLAGVVLLLAAVVGSWLRAGDSTGPFAHIAVDVAAGAHAAWAVALVVAILGIEYGALTGVAITAASLGTSLVALSLSRAGDWGVGLLLLVAPIGLLGGGAAGWAVFGAAWSVVGLLELRDWDRDRDPVRLA